jgi:hypothetical protein
MNPLLVLGNDSRREARIQFTGINASMLDLLTKLASSPHMIDQYSRLHLLSPNAVKIISKQLKNGYNNLPQLNCLDIFPPPSCPAAHNRHTSYQTTLRYHHPFVDQDILL